MRGFQISPALHNFSRGDAPDYDAAELKPFAGLRIGSGPVIAHHDFVIFRNHVFDLHMKIRGTLQRSSDVLDCPAGPGGIPDGTSAP